MDAFWTLAWPVLMGIAAVGAVLFIKIARRRQATRTQTFGGTVPARPLSGADARAMTRRYAFAATAILGMLLLFGWIVATQA